MKKVILYVSLIFLVFSSIWLIKSIISTNKHPTKNAVSTYVEKELENNKTYNVNSFKSLPDKEITLLEAYKLGLKQAKEYEENPELLFLNSVDDKKTSGHDGKQRNWQGVYTLPTKNHHMVVVIEGGRLKNYTIISSSTELSIKESEIKTDSDLIAKKAIKQFKLKPDPKEDPFSHGYHFRLLRDDKNIFLSISGQSNNKNMEIYYNALDGQYLGSSESPIIEGDSK
ncbi:hypothetical protein P4534_13505 [Peribacillus butanolivorans]|uniref:hypothetical protein n=1 Tax=Peribacillus butanolivorans TaxID=421767 RepID=UPI002E22ECD7|nr:hypothetical protein [Peribacillus butanolivorans]